MFQIIGRSKAHAGIEGGGDSSLSSPLESGTRTSGG